MAISLRFDLIWFDLLITRRDSECWYCFQNVCLCVSVCLCLRVSTVLEPPLRLATSAWERQPTVVYSHCWSAEAARADVVGRRSESAARRRRSAGGRRCQRGTSYRRAAASTTCWTDCEPASSWRAAGDERGRRCRATRRVQRPTAAPSCGAPNPINNTLS